MATDEIFVLHDIHDLAQDSDGRSRYGACLAQNTRRFRSANGNLTKDSAEFAAAGFVVASTPIMSPPYIGTHPRVVVASPRWDEDGRCCLLIELATPLPSDIATFLPADVVGWERDPRSSRFLLPEGNGQLAAYGRLSVRLPFPVDLLPPPAYTAMGVPDVQTAKRAVRALSTHANSVLVHLMLDLDGSGNHHGRQLGS